jgi:uncharacterized protein YyaL (SSP411 family)
MDMSGSFRFSPRPNRAAEVRWRPWGGGALEEARRADRPVLLNLTAVWCPWCQRMDETTYSDPALIRLINEELVPIRVDADQYPHVQERYVVSGWPTNAFLTPTGEVLWAGMYVEPEQFQAVAEGVLSAWRERRDALNAEIERRRRALEAARGRHATVGLVRREAADDVVSAIFDAFDARNGGFGEAPKFPAPEAIELLFVHAERLGDERARLMAERTLDGMLVGELFDQGEGGFYRYALAPDWTEPSREKLLEANAALLRAYALGAQLVGRYDWGGVAERVIAWGEERLALPGGLWGGSQLPKDGGRAASPIDPVLYTDANAHWIRSLAEAGGRLGRPEWIERAAAAFDTLLATMAAPDGLFYHFMLPGAPPAVPGLLADAMAVARAALSLAQATGADRFLASARRLAAAMEAHLWADDGGFLDHTPDSGDVGALRYRERPFDRNAAAARLYLDLMLATGERSYRAVAERTLALLSPSAGRYGVEGAEFALAVEEFFEPPLAVVIVGPTDEARTLRLAALALPRGARRVWSMPRGGRVGGLSFPPASEPVAYLCRGRTCSRPIVEPERLATMIQAGR